MRKFESLVVVESKLGWDTYVVVGLLAVVAFLVSLGLLLVGDAVGVAESLPLLTEHLADLAWEVLAAVRQVCRQLMARTEGNAGVLLADTVTLLVGEEHVCRETALGGVGVLLLLAALATLSGALGFGGSLLRHVGGSGGHKSAWGAFKCELTEILIATVKVHSATVHARELRLMVKLFNETVELVQPLSVYERAGASLEARRAARQCRIDKCTLQDA